MVEVEKKTVDYSKVEETFYLSQDGQRFFTAEQAANRDKEVLDEVKSDKTPIGPAEMRKLLGGK